MMQVDRSTMLNLRLPPPGVAAVPEPILHVVKPKEAMECYVNPGFRMSPEVAAEPVVQPECISSNDVESQTEIEMPGITISHIHEA